MKLYRIVWFTAVMATVPQLKPAEPTIQPEVLGRVEAVVSFCARVDAASAAEYKEWGNKVAGEMSKEQLAEIRASSEYKETYDAMTAELEKVPAEKAKESCREGLKGNSQ
jgi:hypothetical protein